MLPFLDKKKVVSTIVAVDPKGGEIPPVDADYSAACRECAQRIISGVKMDDPEKVVSAMKDMFMMFESQPHEETEAEED